MREALGSDPPPVFGFCFLPSPYLRNIERHLGLSPLCSAPTGSDGNKANLNLVVRAITRRPISTDSLSVAAPSSGGSRSEESAAHLQLAGPRFYYSSTQVVLGFTQPLRVTTASSFISSRSELGLIPSPPSVGTSSINNVTARIGAGVAQSE